MELKGSKTEKNLMTAFMGECQARMRYSYYASKAKKDGYVQIKNIFEETSANEKEHAKRLYKLLEAEIGGSCVEVTGSWPVVLGDTKENLIAAAEGEHEEFTDMYPEFARIAKEEGFKEIARVFTEIGEVEERHEIRFRKLLENIESGKVFEREEEVEWKCNNCGYIHKGKKAPEKCPACDHPKAHFELFVETY